MRDIASGQFPACPLRHPYSATGMAGSGFGTTFSETLVEPVGILARLSGTVVTMTARPAEAVWWRLPVRGVTLRGTTQGHAGGRSVVAVVAVHGGPGIDGGGLRHVLAPLSEQAKLVIPDLRGHGRSDLSARATWELDEWADDLACVIDALQLQRPVVVGVSFGGWVALRHAARHPEQVASLVIACTTARLPTVDEGATRMGRLGGPASAAAWREAHVDPAFEASAAFHEHCLSLMALRQPGPALSAVRAAQIKTAQVNAHFTPQFTRLDLTAAARALRCPVTIVVGEQDPLTTPALAAATARACPPGARLRLIPDAAHDLLVDAPDILMDEVRQALAARQ
jgi:pimeloyl-ACP methyl ester carboxylesterase